MPNTEVTSPEPSILQLQPGDVIVATVARQLNHQEKDTMLRDLQLKFPDHNVAIFHGGSSFKIVRPPIPVLH